MIEVLGHYTEVRGTKAYFESCGAGTPVLLLHTAGRDGRQWHDLVQHLRGPFQFIAPDLPGHGKSWPLPGNTCLEDAFQIAEWLHDLVTAISDKPFVVMGCSLGGKLSLLMAALYPDVAAAVAMQGADFPAGKSGFTETSIEIMSHPQNNLTFSQLEFSMSLIGDKATPEGRQFTEWGVLSLIPRAQQGDLRAYMRCDMSDLMKKIVCPVLLVHGSCDWLVSREMVDRTHKALANARHAEIASLEGLGHFPHVEDGRRVAEAAGRFLAKALGPNAGE